MKNTVQINEDQYNIYISLIVKTKTSAKIFLILGILFLTTLIATIFSIGDMNNDSKFFAILVTILIYIVPIKYLLWNFWGKENLIINTKSVSYSFDYVIIKANLTTKRIDKLELFFELGEKDKDQERGHLIFYNYRDEDNLPELLHKTNVLLLKSEVEDIAERIHQLFVHEQNENFGFVKFSDN